ncbi:MAG TPA: GTP 3',8-cyclase MoaA [Burkholderiaceae bacterium]|nr:GTP 3',8-cyclase MoaA [Burkholderiaceae bacterium]
MGESVVPLADLRYAASVPVIPARLQAPTGHLSDRLARALHDLRISVTDRCNFRCGYCMPREVFGRDYQFLPHSSLLTFEEITRLTRLFAGHGVTKVRLTGGEPLLRKGIEQLVAMLVDLCGADGKPLEVTLTTNGSLLARKAQTLKAAGLSRVTVSLDALDDTIFRRMNDADFPLADVLAGIDAARSAGLAPIKVNMVVQRGVNDDQVLPMASHFRGSGIVLRFIEYMDVGATNGWRMDQVVPSMQLLEQLQTAWPLEPLPVNAAGETAERWRYRDGGGEIGFISSVTRAFCRDCNRARLSTEGKLYTCLFATRGHDLRSLLRGGRSDLEISSALADLWSQRSDRYSELRSAQSAGAPGDERRIEMHYIGG